MQEEYNDTEFILVPAKEAVCPAEDDALYYLHRGARSRGYKLERERERSSQVPRGAKVRLRQVSISRVVGAYAGVCVSVLGVIEMSANIGCSESVSSCRRSSLVSICSPLPFL